MKIARIETIPLRVPVRPRFAIKSGRGGSHTVSPFLLVKIHTDAGIIGLGEVSCTPRWSGEDQVTAAHFIQNYLAPQLMGRDPLDRETLAPNFRLAMAGNYFTKAGVEMALWDIAGKAAGKPVYALLGGRVRDFVPTKWSVSGVDPAQASEIAQWAARQGFNTMKVKVGIDPDSDLARVQAVREAVGPEIKLGVDANGGWPPEIAARIIVRLREFGIGFVEQPVAPEDALCLEALRNEIQLPVILDESIGTLQDARMLARLNAADAFSIYIGKAGGIEAARTIAEFAGPLGIRCTLGSNLELGIGSAAMVHLAIASRAITAEEFPCDIIGPFFYEHDLLQEPLPIRPGEARPNEKPGLGVELDEDQVARHRVA